MKSSVRVQASAETSVNSYLFLIDEAVWGARVSNLLVLDPMGSKRIGEGCHFGGRYSRKSDTTDVAMSTDSFAG